MKGLFSVTSIALITLSPLATSEAQSGHEAGYESAKEKGITDPDDCGGNSQSFIEGCEEYAEGQQQVMRAEEADEDEESYESEE